MNEKCRKVVSVTGINNLINPEHEDWWSDVAVLTNQRERIGYPTQKPLALLDRIIKASSNEGDMVLDPFAGCATACVAAERLDRVLFQNTIDQSRGRQTCSGLAQGVRWFAVCWC